VVLCCDLRAQSLNLGFQVFENVGCCRRGESELRVQPLELIPSDLAP